MAGYHLIHLANMLSLQAQNLISVLEGLGVNDNPRPGGVFSRTRLAGGGGEVDSVPLCNFRTEGRRETGKAAN